MPRNRREAHCINGHDLNDPDGAIRRFDKNGRPYRRCKKCLEGSKWAIRRERSAHRKKKRDTFREKILPPPRDYWRDEAACGGKDVELFFQDWGEKDAMQLCEECPVRMDCLSANLYEKFGIFGGMNPHQRDTFVRKHRKRARKNANG